MLRSTLSVTLLFGVTLFAVQSGDARSITDDENTTKGKCTMGKKEYAIGEEWSVLGECNIYKCHEGGGISALTCAAVMLPENSPCTFSEIDLKKLYPKCCPQPICP